VTARRLVEKLRPDAGGCRARALAASLVLLVALPAPVCTGFLTVERVDPHTVVQIQFVTQPGPDERVSPLSGPVSWWHASASADTYVTLINVGQQGDELAVVFRAPDGGLVAEADMDVGPGTMQVVTAGQMIPACRAVQAGPAS
jgi:hypothetical protein